MRNFIYLLLIATTSSNCFSKTKQAASFDCTKATFITEQAICQNNYLSISDRALASQYEKLTLLKMPNLKKSQREWIKERNKCQTNISCIKESYDKRLKELNALYRVNSYKTNKEGHYIRTYWWPGVKAPFYHYSAKTYPTCDAFSKSSSSQHKYEFGRCSLGLSAPFRNLQWEKINNLDNIGLVRQIILSRDKQWFNEDFFQKQLRHNRYNIYSTTITSIAGEKEKYFKLEGTCMNDRSFSNNFFYKMEGDKKLMPLYRSGVTELFQYQGKVFGYSLGEITHDENGLELGKILQEVDVYEKLPNEKLGNICRFIYTQNLSLGYSQVSLRDY